MTSVGAYQAKTHLPALLKRANKGEKIIITLHGVPVALLSEPPQPTSGSARHAIQQMKQLRRGITLGKDLTIRGMIEEGRRL